MADREFVNVLGVLKPLLADRKRREVLLALTAAYMLVQLSSLPVALALPSIAEAFDTSIADAAWMVIIYLLILGSLVLLGARLGDKYGHARVFFIGILFTTAGAILIALSQELWHLIMWRGVSGLGAALVLGNSNAILAATFPPEERGRAFAVPITGSRFGTLAGLAIFGLFLHFLDWRWVFFSFVPLGTLGILGSIPMLRHEDAPRTTDGSGPIDWTGGLLLAAAGIVMILSGSHLHGGEESFLSFDGLTYHLPMHGLFLVLVVAFIIVERMVSNPVVDPRHFRQLPFSVSLGANVTYHFSMLATMTLVPILVEEGFGKSPLYVTIVLLPSQSLGLFMPMIAGWIYDKYQPQLLRPMLLAWIACGFLALGLASTHVSFWVIPLLMLPISIATNMFNPVNNATIMSSLPIEHRGVASGMLETTRELGHALGATIAAGVLALALPSGIERMPDTLARPFFVEGFQLSSIMVVFVLLLGATLAYVQRAPVLQRASPPQPSASYQPGGDD